ncbi:metalloregulator ArsR/SmtB family transcription factor [Cellulomonas hominis]
MSNLQTLPPRPGPGTDDCTPMPSPADHAMGADAASRVAATLKALGDPLRLRMLSLVATSPTGEACVCDLATVAEVAQPTVSHHLKLLKDAGLLTSERRGTWVYYRVQPALRGAVSTLLESFAPATLRPPAAHGPMTGLNDADPALRRIADRLAAAHPGLGHDLVLATVRESYTALARTAAVPAHLIVNTERFARQRLADAARATARSTPAGRPPQVLFVCVANAGRSQLAAALLQHYAGAAVVVRSAGSAPAADVHAGVRPELDELGVTDDAFPKPLTDDAVRAADVVITMGCGDTCPILPGKRYEDWVVGDPALASPAGVRAIRAEIDRRVRALLADLLPDLDVPIR